MNEEQVFEDKEITCMDCKATFTWTVRDQEFYAEKQFTAPKRCKVCAKARRAYIEAHPNQSSRKPAQAPKRNRDDQESY
jgi:hypothetical protein